MNPWNEDIRIAQQYINALRSASLENSGLDDTALENLKNPPDSPIELGDSDEERDTRLSLKLFIGLARASEKEYTASRSAISDEYPDSELLSYDQVRKRVATMTGIYPVLHDMCPESCMAYTGPFDNMESCIR